MPTRKLTGICLIIAASCSSGFVLAKQNAERVIEYTIDRTDPEVIAHGLCGDNGNCISVELSAPGPINHIEYHCDKGACDRTHPCPDVGNQCNEQGGTKHDKEFDVDGNQATFWAWTNSSDSARYRFAIYYNDVPGN